MPAVSSYSEECQKALGNFLADPLCIAYWFDYEGIRTVISRPEAEAEAGRKRLYDAVSQ